MFQSSTSDFWNHFNYLNWTNMPIWKFPNQGTSQNFLLGLYFLEFNVFYAKKAVAIASNM